MAGSSILPVRCALGAATFSAAIITTPPPSGSADAGEFPAELVEFGPPSATPLFAGGGPDAWDRDLRERGWIVREGSQLQIKEEAISVEGYEQKLAEDIGLRLVQIPAGRFEMGSPAAEEGRDANEGPQHQVQLQSFFLGQTPVTQAQWKVVAGWPKVGVDLSPTPSSFKGDNLPVERVSWEEAMEFWPESLRVVEIPWGLSPGYAGAELTTAQGSGA
jgi:hypothetical protein